MCIRDSNRPGYQINTAGAVTDINGSNQAINEFSIGTEFDVQNANNVLYQFNSIHGGVILPRGTSIVGMDLRKTKVRPKFIPDPNNANINTSAIFRVTGGCYFREVTIFDGCLLYTSPSPRDKRQSRMPSSA